MCSTHKTTHRLITNRLLRSNRAALWESSPRWQNCARPSPSWKNKDAKKIEDLTAKEITFVNIFGTYFADKADALKDWTGATCDVTSFTLTDGVGTTVSPTVGILTLTGTVNTTCGGKDISGQKIYGNSVYVKDGDAWKWVFGFNSPS